MPSKTKPGPEALAFIVAALKADKNVSYKEVKERADKKGLSIFPVMYGRAKALLGMVKVSPRGQGRFAMAKKGIVIPKAGLGRPAKSAPAVSGAGGLEGVLAAVKSNEQERLRLRITLERLQAIISEALA
jgi:malate/lactate dehydrogenase